MAFVNEVDHPVQYECPTVIIEEIVTVQGQDFVLPCRQLRRFEALDIASLK
jgi:hypothetical protein